jgi:alkylation response protein AidB-like acyl-CoA dehydrogenase
MFEEAGLAHPAELGLAAECAVAEVAGYHAAPLPIVETILAGRLLADAGLPVPAGALTVVVVESGVSSRAAWDECIAHAVLVFPEPDGPMAVALVPRDALLADISCNLADEPRAVLRGGQAHRGAAQPAAHGWEHYRAMGALLKAAQIGGAIARVLAMSVEHANTRKQFGKAIGSFQAIQQQLAILAEECAAARCAVAQAGVDGATHGQFLFRAAIAKARAGEAASQASAIAHQVHGAIGFAMEHDLHLFTRRLLAWRGEFGNDRHWQAVIGRMVAARGGEALWPMLAN